MDTKQNLDPYQYLGNCPPTDPNFFSWPVGGQCYSRQASILKINYKAISTKNKREDMGNSLLNEKKGGKKRRYLHFLPFLQLLRPITWVPGSFP